MRNMRVTTKESRRKELKKICSGEEGYSGCDGFKKHGLEPKTNPLLVSNEIGDDRKRADKKLQERK